MIQCDGCNVGANTAQGGLNRFSITQLDTSLAGAIDGKLNPCDAAFQIAKNFRIGLCRVGMGKTLANIPLQIGVRL